MRNLTLSDIEQLRAEASESDVALEMDEEAFRAFYDRTARILRAYLSRVTGDAAAGGRPAPGDVLSLSSRSERLRERSPPAQLALPDCVQPRSRPLPAAPWRADSRDRRGREGRSPIRRSLRGRSAGTDLRRALARLRPRDRELLWLAYAQGSSHREIADFLGLKTGSIKLLLFRARRRLANLLRGSGYGDHAN